MKCTRFPLQEAANRIHEKFNQIKNVSKTKYPILSKIIKMHVSNDVLYEKIVLKNVSTISINFVNNNFIMLKKH